MFEAVKVFPEPQWATVRLSSARMGRQSKGRAGMVAREDRARLRTCKTTPRRANRSCGSGSSSRWSSRRPLWQQRGDAVDDGVKQRGNVFVGRRRQGQDAGAGVGIAGRTRVGHKTASGM